MESDAGNNTPKAAQLTVIRAAWPSLPVRESGGPIQCAIVAVKDQEDFPTVLDLSVRSTGVPKTGNLALTSSTVTVSSWNLKSLMLEECSKTKRNGSQTWVISLRPQSTNPVFSRELTHVPTVPLIKLR